MKIRNGKWLALGAATLGASAVSIAACGGDDSSGPGLDGAVPDVTVADTAQPDVDQPDVQQQDANPYDAGPGDAGPGDAGPGDAQPDGGPQCGVPPDPDTTPKVRLVNLLLPTNASVPADQGVPPAIRLYAGDSAVSGIDLVSANMGPASVTQYAKVTAGKNITFSARALGTDGGVSFSVSAAIDVAAGEHLTIFAVGNPALKGGKLKAKLVVVPDQFPAANCDQAAFRFVNAGYDPYFSDSFVVGQGANPAASLAYGAVSDATGLVTPVTTKSVTIITSSSPQYEGPTGQAPFTLPALAGGRGYYVINSGEPFRANDDPRDQRLLLLPVGDDTPATWIKRDPLVYLFHAAPGVPANLQVQSGGNTIALVNYAGAAGYTDLPPAGATLDFVQAPVADAGVDAGSAGGAVLTNQVTGALAPGSVYVGGILGTSGGDAGATALQSKFWKIQPSIQFNTDNNATRGVFVNAALSAPTVDVGYWNSVNGTKTDPFTTVFSNIAWGAMTDATGANFSPPGIGNQQWVGAQLAGLPATNRAAQGSVGATWDVIVLLGDWSAPNGGDSAQLVFMSLGAGPTTVTPFPLPPP